MNTQKKLFMSMLAVLVAVGTVSTTAWAANDIKEMEPRGVYIRELVEYIPIYTSIDDTYQEIGFISADNRGGSSPLQITYVYTSSGTTTASFAGHGNGTAEAGVIFAKMKVEIGVELGYSRSWTQGTSSGASYVVQPGAFQKLCAYIPAAKTEGRLKYKVYMDGYPENVFYEYESLGGAAFAPLKYGIHFKTIDLMGRSYDD